MKTNSPFFNYALRKCKVMTQNQIVMEHRSIKNVTSQLEQFRGDIALKQSFKKLMSLFVFFVNIKLRISPR